MLILSRSPSESIEIRISRESLERLAALAGEQGVLLRVMVTEIRGDKARLGVDAPREFSVHRAEVQRAIEHQLVAH